MPILKKGNRMLLIADLAEDQQSGVFLQHKFSGFCIERVSLRISVFYDIWLPAGCLANPGWLPLGYPDKERPDIRI